MLVTVSLDSLNSYAARVAQGEEDRSCDVWRALPCLPCPQHPQVAGQGAAPSKPLPDDQLPHGSDTVQQNGFQKSETYTFSAFTDKLAMSLFRRPGISKVFQKFAAGSRMTVKEFREFLLHQQLEDVGEGYAASLMRQIANQESFGVHEFETYLESHHNAAWDPTCANVCVFGIHSLSMAYTIAGGLP